MRHLAVVAGLCLLGGAGSAAAHEGPERVLERLNRQMDQQGVSADVLFRRASIYRSQRQYQSAAAELKRALELEPEAELIRLELLRIRLKQFERVLVAAGDRAGMRTMAAGLLERSEALLSSRDAGVRAATLAVRGQLYRHLQQPLEAATAFEAALQIQPDHVQWVLWRAEAQQRLDRHGEAVEGLGATVQRTGHPVLEAALCDALLTWAERDDRASEASLRQANRIIDHRLAASRLKSGWQIRKARGLIIAGRHQEAAPLLQAATAELDLRINDTRPDPELLRRRAEVNGLLAKTHR
ncbi:tetratricopeptide repeat protein [Roseimaritima sediminicola]|uniref:tetratricopeptide repeat protein n=1 Tax=Roseimaritima sediminicola TaxID=2662066 RepID=UPI0013875922|nr:tetratricopeptide repeat protein [Roseimaritima sediminicola]